MKSWTASDWIQVIGALGGFVGIVSVNIIAIMNGRKSNANSDKLDVQAQKLQENTDLTRDVHSETQVVKAVITSPSPQITINTEPKS